MLSKLMDNLTKEDDRRLASILLKIIIIYWLGSALVLVMDQLWGNKTMWTWLVMGCLFQFIPMFFLLRGNLSASSLSSVGLYIIFVTIFATIGQGVRDYVLMVYPAMIMLAGLTEKRRGLVMSTALTLAALAWLTFGEIYGIFKLSAPVLPTVPDFIVMGVIIILATLAVHFLLENLERTHNQTKAELIERERAEKSLLELKENLQALIENLDGSAWSVDTQYRLIIGNNLYHQNVSAVIKRPHYEGENVLELELPQEAISKWKGYYDRALKGEKFVVETETNFKSTPLDIEYRFNPIMEESGAVVGVTVLGRDITEQRHIENALIQSEQRFKSYVQNAPNIITVIDQQNRIQFINRTEFALPRSMFFGNSILNFITAEQHETVRHALQQARETGEPATYQTSSQINNEIFWYDNYAVMVDPHNPSSEIIIISNNVTERQRAENALNTSESKYRLLAERISDVIWILDLNEMRFRYVSQSVEKLRGFTVEEVMSQKMSEVLTPASQEFLEENLPKRIQDFRDGKLNSYTSEMEQPRKDGSTVWTEVTTSFHINEINGHLEVYGVTRDITERRKNEKLLKEANEQLRIHLEKIEQLHAELREQAIRDPLTGLYNRRYMQEIFKREFSRSARERSPLSLIMLDMDGLKEFNDTYGHHVGDQSIKTLATRIRSMIRAEDIICRYGGDEFTIIMSKTTAEDAFKRVAEWRKSLSEDEPLPIGESITAPIKFTAGIASFPLHSNSMDELLNYADVALYRAKSLGRNCTVTFG
jgi:diguanylate cyclase (GGDEF)-like protein/PAS domain S-box-containing protein